MRQHQERGRGEVAVTSESQPALETLSKDSFPLSPELLRCFQLDLFEVRRPMCQWAWRVCACVLLFFLNKANRGQPAPAVHRQQGFVPAEQRRQKKEAKCQKRCFNDGGMEIEWDSGSCWRAERLQRCNVSWFLPHLSHSEAQSQTSPYTLVLHDRMSLQIGTGALWDEPEIPPTVVCHAFSFPSDFRKRVTSILWRYIRITWHRKRALLLLNRYPLIISSYYISAILSSITSWLWCLRILLIGSNFGDFGCQIVN